MPSLDDIGKLVLRVTIGGLMLPHGMAKFNAKGLEGIQGLLASKGLPEAMAYGVFVGEVLAPILMIIGYFTRPAATVFAFTMAMAIFLAHGNQLTQLNEHGGLQLEVQYLYLLVAVAVALLGAGKYSTSGGGTKWD